jgi:hypothetical protein
MHYTVRDRPGDTTFSMTDPGKRLLEKEHMSLTAVGTLPGLSQQDVDAIKDLYSDAPTKTACVKPSRPTM